MSQVKIGPKFFANELRVYRDWATAFWRENIQNSFDAGAGRIDINIGENVDGITRVTFADDGKGMNRDTLENVYFTLGETTKNANSVGGFGKARILTCFAQSQYTLATRNLIVNGSGADYVIEESDVHHPGVLLGIDVYNHGKDLLPPLQEYLKRCHLDGTQVYVNGVRHTDWTYKNKFERELTFGKIYTNKSKSAGMLVRVNGVQMFSPWMSAPFLVIVEIDQSKSRTVLQASRDGLLHEYQAELESFINDLNINKQSALRKNKSKSTEYKGTGTFTARRIKKPTGADVADMFAALIADSDAEIAPDGIADLKSTIENAKDPEAVAKVLIQRMKDVGTQFTAPKESAAPVHNSGYHEDSDRQYMSFEMFDTIIVDDTSNAAVRKVIESYYPQNWDLLGQNGSRFSKAHGEYRTFRAGVDKYKLLILWKAACEFCIRLLQDEMQQGEEEINWGIGWCFSDDAAAKHKEANGVHWLLLNPCDGKGNMALSLQKPESLAKLVSHAAHEVAHTIYTDHDERWGNLCNDIQELLFLNKREILAHMKTCKEDAEADLARQALVAA